MSSLMVSNDLDIMMLEFAVEKLFIPKKSVFDTVIMKKTTVMFRMLDSDWIPVNPHRTDHVPYKGSNREELNFHGGKSVVFAIPAISLEKKMKDVDIQMNVVTEVSKYFEVDENLKRQNVGVALANVDCLFNGIIKDLREREELKEYLNCFHKRQPISRSLKETYDILDENKSQTGSTLRIYVRLSHFGKSVITEIEIHETSRPTFNAQEETNENNPYQCRELTQSELTSGRWAIDDISSIPKPESLICRCEDWKIVDRENARRSGTIVDGTKIEKSEGKGKRDRSSNESVEKRGGKSSGDNSQVRSVVRTKKNIGIVGKTDKPIRITKSAEEKSNRTKNTMGKGSSRVSKTLETSGFDVGSGQKPRTSLRNRGRVGKEDGEDGEVTKVKKIEVGDGSKSMGDDYTKMLEQLRKRRGGVVTVGIDEKKKNNCEKVIKSTCKALGNCGKSFEPISERFCANFEYGGSCCYPRTLGCDGSSIARGRGCFVERPDGYCNATLDRRVIRGMQIVTN